ncbi:MAG: DUF87 domain-containing protein [Pirellulales bacterium]
MFKLANNLSLPVDAVNQKLAVLGRSGSGKSSVAVCLAEEMLARGYPLVAIDPTGAWWGLQSSADGKRAGYPVVIFGGEHGHLPLLPTGGTVAADFVVHERMPTVFDLAGFGENEMRRFVGDFAKQLYRTNREALHVFIDEADEFAPQGASGGYGAECHGAIQNIVRRGRIKGLGVTLITQRSAVIDKSILYQTECLIAMQLTGPRDMEAVEGWIKYHGTKEEREKIMATLPRLGRGEGWVYSPSWLKRLAKVQFRLPTTFDSRKEPEPGKPRPLPKRVADVNLDRVQKQMAATVEAAKANDPAELKKQIAELRRQVAGKSPAGKPVVDPEAIAKAEARGEARGRAAAEQEARQEARQLRAVVIDRDKRLGKIEQLAHLNGDAGGKISAPAVENLPRVAKPAIPVAREGGRKPAPEIRNLPTTIPDGDVSTAQQRILDSIAWWCAIGCNQPARGQVAFAAGYTVNGHFNNLVGSLRTAGMIEYPQGDHLCFTDAGAAAANLPDEPPTLDEFHARIREKLETPLCRLFDVLVAARTQGESPLPTDLFASRAGYTVNGHFNNLRGRLHTLGLADYCPGGCTQASNLAFPEALV